MIFLSPTPFAMTSSLSSNDSARFCKTDRGYGFMLGKSNFTLFFVLVSKARNGKKITARTHKPAVTSFRNHWGSARLSATPSRYLVYLFSQKCQVRPQLGSGLAFSDKLWYCHTGATDKRQAGGSPTAFAEGKTSFCALRHIERGAATYGYIFGFIRVLYTHGHCHRPRH